MLLNVKMPPPVSGSGTVGLDVQGTDGLTGFVKTPDICVFEEWRHNLS